jgi:hypothetical protein
VFDFKELLLFLAEADELLHPWDLAEHFAADDHVEQVAETVELDRDFARLHKLIAGDATHLLDGLLILCHGLVALAGHLVLEEIEVVEVADEVPDLLISAEAD